MALENPNAIIYHLRRAVGELSLAHGVAGESEGNWTNLNGPSETPSSASTPPWTLSSSSSKPH